MTTRQYSQTVNIPAKSKVVFEVKRYQETPAKVPFKGEYASTMEEGENQAISSTLDFYYYSDEIISEIRSEKISGRCQSEEIYFHEGLDTAEFEDLFFLQ